MQKVRKQIIFLKDDFDSLINTVKDIFDGYKNMMLAKIGLIDENSIIKYEEKAEFCNKNCPLFEVRFGLGFCSSRKEFEGIIGCGCIREAKLWSDSQCPMGKF